jgi:hypothetical protein
MKVLYVASKSPVETDLMLTAEITELQRRFAARAADVVEFNLLPDLSVEELPGELSRFRPDILHIASHGEDEGLSLSARAGDAISVSAPVLHAFLPPNRIPRLIYLNACNSGPIAKELALKWSVPMTIGSTAPITNRAARSAAVAFYDRLLAGLPVHTAFVTCKRMLEAMTKSHASANLFHSQETKPELEILHPVPMLLADFGNPQARPHREGEYSFRLGLRGCPANTTQVIFFTDDESFAGDEEDWENDMSWIIRTAPVNGVIWSSDAWWRANGDHRLFAVCARAGSDCFTVAGMLCEAIENRYRSSRGDKLPTKVAVALEHLRANNGEELNPAVWKGKRTASKRHKARR